ncbi:MAG: hypothetical protein ACLQVY_28240 [Limisphaerales bacterium]
MTIIISRSVNARPPREWRSPPVPGGAGVLSSEALAKEDLVRGSLGGAVLPRRPDIRAEQQLRPTKVALNLGTVALPKPFGSRSGERGRPARSLRRPAEGISAMKWFSKESALLIPRPASVTPAGATGTVALPGPKNSVHIGASSSHCTGRRRGADSRVAMEFIKIITNCRW